jgi:hypothetical protein
MGGSLPGQAFGREEGNLSPGRTRKKKKSFFAAAHAVFHGNDLASYTVRSKPRMISFHPAGTNA